MRSLRQSALGVPSAGTSQSTPKCTLTASITLCSLERAMSATPVRQSGLNRANTPFKYIRTSNRDRRQQNQSISESSSSSTYAPNNTISQVANGTTGSFSDAPFTSLNTSTSLFTSNATATRTSSSVRQSISASWSYSSTPSRTSSGSAASKSTFVPGVIFNLSLSGTSDSEAVYGLEMSFGHATPLSSSDLVLPYIRRADWDGQALQILNMQVDLGSSDMWIASDLCTSSDCQTAPMLFNASQSIDTGVALNLTFESGSVDGEIFWEQVTLGTFGIGYQAFVLADVVNNEDLSGGNFTGLLGLALPANSVIEDQIPGTTGSSPDGATFLDNLFGSGSSTPSQRLFSLSLERREDVRTTSTLGIGAIDSNYCPSPCSLTYVPIIAQPNLGATGFLYWRVQLDSISATTFSDAAQGTGASSSSIVLGASQVDASKSTPIAVLDSGGVAILVGYKPFADSIYSAFGVTASADGLYRLPCKQPISLTVTIGGKDYPIHPLDMSWVDPSDASQTTCIGAIQYSSSLGQSGDFVLGSSFLKNVYSIFQYPDTNKTDQSSWQPTVGLVSLTNASIASQDFYAVRTLHESLGSVSSAQQSSVSGAKPSSSSTSASADAASHKVVSTAIIAASSVVGFFVLAAVAFCAWWFWFRRKLGAAGVVEYRTAPIRPSHRSELSTSTFRSRKHEETKRQKSMIDGFSDCEVDSWRSTTEGDGSIRLANLPEVIEEHDDDGQRVTRGADTKSDFTRDSSLCRSILTSDPSSPGWPLNDIDPLGTITRRESSPSDKGNTSPTNRLIDLASPTSSHATLFNASSVSTSTGQALSMSGPFPTPNRPLSVMRPTEYEYFPVIPASTSRSRNESASTNKSRRPSQAS